MLLAIDTASKWMSVALHDGQHLLAEHTHYSNNQHTVQLSILIEQLLKNAEKSVADLTVLAISQGPGSYSGLRIGFSLAKGLAAARRLPLIGIPTHEVIASAAPHLGEELIAVVQAGRGRVIAGRYHWSASGWQAHNTPEITAWENLNVSDQTLLIGEIDPQGVAHLQPQPQILSSAWNLRRAGFLAELAWKAPLTVDLGAVNPIYLKGSV